MRRLLFILAMLTGAAFAQQGNTLMLTGAGAPTGNCAFMFLYTNSTNADLYNCLNGSWNKVTSAGGGGNVSTTQTNVYGAFLQDFSAATMEIPESAAFVTTVDSTIGIDTNTGIEHLWGPGSADALNVVTSSTSTTPTNVLHATATAGLYALSPVVAGDAPTLAPLASPTFTGVVTFPAGTPTAPGFVSSLSSTFGLTAQGTTNWCMGTGSANNWSMCWNTAGKLEVISGGIFGFSSSATNAGSTGADGGISRLGAASLAAGNGSAGDKTSLFTAKRYTVDGGTTLVAGDFALSAGWGTTASIAISLSTSKDAAAIVTVTSAGTGQAANPTLLLTFHDGTWTNVPACVLLQNGGTDIFGDVTGVAVGVTAFATAYTWTWNGTPTAAKNYVFVIQCTGT